VAVTRDINIDIIRGKKTYENRKITKNRKRKKLSTTLFTMTVFTMVLDFFLSLFPKGFLSL